MKKILIILCVILSTLCSGCAFLKKDYIDIVELYNKNYNENIITELNYNYAGLDSPIIITELILLQKKHINDEQYEKMTKKLDIEFENLIFMKVKLQGIDEWDYYLGVIECKSSEYIKNYFKNIEVTSAFKIKKNIGYFAISGLCLLLEECIEEGDLLYSDDKKTLHRGKDLNGVFQVPEDVEMINHCSFRYNNQITKLICNNSLEYIGQAAFQNVFL